MESVIDTNTPLDYVEFQLFPNHDRYEACACQGNTIETISSGLLGQLVLHLPRLKDLFSRGSKATFQIQCPENLDSSQWFTKTTVTRFLHFVGSVNILTTTTTILNEITQLEEAKKFHLSLYAKDESETAPSDESKHELLRAMELRLTTLKTELATAFNRAAGSSCTPKTISNLEKFAQHLGDKNLRDAFRKFLEYSKLDKKVDNETANNPDEMSQAKKLSDLERQSSTESDKSCNSSDDDQPSEERSRSLARVASPRRLASPMRRVQIGRSGSRRATAITIKSLNIFPGRDKAQSCRETIASSYEEEGSTNPPKKTESNAVRISVKDAISLFENKKNNDTFDAQKNAATAHNKPVLRRWSSGVDNHENFPESSQLISENMEMKTSDIRLEENKPVEDDKVDENFCSVKEKMSKPIDNQPDILVIQHEEDTENLSVTSEWNRRNEAELNGMMAKMMQSKPVRNRNRNTVSNKNRTQDVPSEKRGELYDKSKVKKDEKDAQFRVLEKRKAAIASANLTAVTRSKSSLSNPEKFHKSSTQNLNSKRDSPKPAFSKEAPSKTPSSSVRKSWSDTPSPRASIRGVSPAKTPSGTSSAGPTPTRRKPQPGPTGPQPSPKVERTLQRPKPKPVQATNTDTRKSAKSAVKKQQSPTSKNAKILKTKGRMGSEKESSKDLAKPSFYNKVTKKSSVVPLDSKPFLRKGTGPVAKTIASSPIKEPVKSPETPITIEENEVSNDAVDSVCQRILDENAESVETCADLPLETQLTTKHLSDEIATCELVITNSDDRLRRMSHPSLKTDAEEDLTISPTAWIDTEEHEDSCIPQGGSMCENPYFVKERPLVTASPRVRHSLSQMLLKETELDVAEWGSAEIVPSIVYQKDAPKGFKRLLKFARKSKGDQNSTGWSTPSAFSEGEDDNEEFKFFSKKNADISLRKAALHTSNHEHQKPLLEEEHEIEFAGPQRLSAHLKLNNFSTSSGLLDHNSGSFPTNKATRSFFSLSAFRGKQTNETKFR